VRIARFLIHDGKHRWKYPLAQAHDSSIVPKFGSSTPGAKALS
jgi:hypothetical protein